MRRPATSSSCPSATRPEPYPEWRAEPGFAAGPAAVYGFRVANPAAVSLLRWLRRQLREPLPVREHLEAAVAADDPAEVGRLLAGFDFTPAQRHHVEALLAAWEE